MARPTLLKRIIAFALAGVLQAPILAQEGKTEIIAGSPEQIVEVLRDRNHETIVESKKDVEEKFVEIHHQIRINKKGDNAGFWTFARDLKTTEAKDPKEFYTDSVSLLADLIEKAEEEITGEADKQIQSELARNDAP